MQAQAVAREEEGSFRDPSGRVYTQGEKVFRTVSNEAERDLRAVMDSGLIERLTVEDRLVGSGEVAREVLGEAGAAAAMVLEHPRLPLISYPYEWSFSVLKSAALFHLDLHLDCLAEGFNLSDASAYNVQFKGWKPIFIDTLSLRPYEAGEYWIGHRQFCEQFLNPLLLQAKLNVAHNAWFRGNLEGIPTADLARLLPWWRKLSWTVLTNVALPARLQASALGKGGDEKPLAARRPLPLSQFQAMLKQLRGYIAKLEPSHGLTTWSDYTDTHSYASEEEQEKRAFVARFVEKTKPARLWDLGCNTGAYSELALESGAAAVVGFDIDLAALDGAYERARTRDLQFLPLYLDAANPAPDQGWRGGERKSLMERANGDGLIALAFLHHLAIGRNAPLDQAVAWLVSLAPTGVVEFVQKTDPMIERMLRLREDIFADYTEQTFVNALERVARVVDIKTVSAAGRKLFWYDRR